METDKQVQVCRDGARRPWHCAAGKSRACCAGIARSLCQRPNVVGLRPASAGPNKIALVHGFLLRDKFVGYRLCQQLGRQQALIHDEVVVGLYVELLAQKQFSLGA